jgi:hypothetical protein
MRWRRHDPSARGSNDTPLAYTLFEPDELSAIARRAEERGAKTASFLLWALDRAVYDPVAEPAPTHIWALPVNMRGAVGGDLEQLDIVAVAIPVPVPERGTPAQVKSAIRACLEDDAHWAAWYALRILASLGPDRIRSQVTSYYSRSTYASVGTFTSVGPYDVADAGWVAVVPPPLRTHPIAAGAVTVGGRLALALTIHPVLGPVDPNPLIERWRAYAEGKLTD